MDLPLGGGLHFENSGYLIKNRELRRLLSIAQILGYILHCFDVRILVGGIDANLVQRELMNGKGVQPGGYLLLDGLLQFAHGLSLIDIDRKWGRFADNDAPKSVRHGK